MSPDLRTYEVPAEFALFGVTAATIFSLDNVFQGRTYLVSLLVSAATVHLITAVVRRLSRSLLLSLVASSLGLLVQLSATYYFSSTVVGIPTRATYEAVRPDLSSAWQVAQSGVPPLEAETGLMVVLAAIMLLIIILSDWAAFRLRSSVEALLPALVGFITASLFDQGLSNLFTGTVFLVAALVFLLTHRASMRMLAGTWLGTRTAPAWGSLILSGLVLGGLALAATVYLGPSIPGYGDRPVRPLADQLSGGQSGSTPRTVISPLVDIKGRITEQPDLEVFTVRTTRPTYYRLTSLNAFSGDAWTSQADYGDADGVLPTAFPITIPDAEIATVQQTFDIAALGQVWLPAAYQPMTVRASNGEGISYEPASSTLITDRDVGFSDGLVYSVQSRIPRYTVDNLQTGGTAQIPEVYLELPPDFSPEAARIAAEVVAGKTTRFEQALALQDFFRDGFSYDLNVPKGHSTDAIENFLEVRRGYCEQFSGTYAAMARSVGLASRVAVGFTFGTQDPDDPTLYHVRSEHAHAWPEVFIPGAGWVAFEPTPGRGAPGTEQYTGVPAAQQESSTPEAEQPIDEQATDAQNAPAPDFGPDVPQDLSDGAEETPDDSGLVDDALDPQASTQVRGWLLLVAALALLPIVAMVAIAMAKRAGWRRGISGLGRANEPTERISLAWEQTLDRIALSGCRYRTGETPTEFAVRADAELGLEGGHLEQLGATVTSADYAIGGPSDAEADRARELADAVASEVGTRWTFGQKIRWEIDPAPLWMAPDRRWSHRGPTVLKGLGSRISS